MSRLPLLSVMLVAGLTVCTTVEGAGCDLTFKGEDMKFGGCKELKSTGIKVFWSFTEADTIKVAYTRSASTNEYVAFGFSTAEAGDQMIPNSAVVSFPQGDDVVYHDYDLRGRSGSEVIAGEGGQNLASIEAETADDVFVTVFERPLAGTPALAPDMEFGVLYAVGPAPETGTMLGYHTTRDTETLNLTSAADMPEKVPNPSDKPPKTDGKMTAAPASANPSDNPPKTDGKTTEAPASAVPSDNTVDPAEDEVCIEATRIPLQYKEYLVHPAPLVATVYCVEAEPNLPCGTAHHTLKVDGRRTSYKSYCDVSRCFKKRASVNAVYKHRWTNQLYKVGGTEVTLEMGDDRYHSALYGAAHIALELWSRVQAGPGGLLSVAMDKGTNSY